MRNTTGDSAPLQTFTVTMEIDHSRQTRAITIDGWPFTYEDHADRRILCGLCLLDPKQRPGGEDLNPPLLGLLHVTPPDRGPRRLHAQLYRRFRVDEEPKPKPIFDGFRIYGKPSRVWWDDFRGERLIRGEAFRCGRSHTLWLSRETLAKALDKAETAGLVRDMYIFDAVPG